MWSEITYGMTWISNFIPHFTGFVVTYIHAGIQVKPCWYKGPGVSIRCWGWVTHICVSNHAIIVSYYGLSHARCQAVIWTSAGKMLIGRLLLLANKFQWKCNRNTSISVLAWCWWPVVVCVCVCLQRLKKIFSDNLVLSKPSQKLFNWGLLSLFILCSPSYILGCLHQLLGPHLLIWINFNPDIDK